MIFSLGKEASSDPELQPYKPVVRWEPRELTSPQPDAPLLTLEDGTVLRPNDFEDLILNDTLRHEPCGSG